ncbi:hypothetical protein B296_00000197 [Ensete ventricosum]|uniref:Uncharacterized protein n=1 Tax=Ensete ventricosum TaxID=4639 RepID=A0A427BC56_ENSVE|nr:hypothetical protein B296_00000197 [Ensete ventricosum]
MSLRQSRLIPSPRAWRRNRPWAWRRNRLRATDQAKKSPGFPLLLSPSLADTARNRPMTVEIDRYRPTTIKIDRYQSISHGNGWKQPLHGGTAQ